VGTLFVDYARGDVGLSVGLLLGLTFSSVVLTPILIGLWTGGDVSAALSATAWPIMKLILVFQVVPLVAGLLLRRYAESRTRRAQPWIAGIARWLMLGIIVAYVVTKGQLLLANGLRPFVVSVGANLASFLLGWSPLLRPNAERVSLGLTSMNRNLALALLLAATFFTHPSTIATVLAYGLLMLILAFAVAAWFRRSTPALERAPGRIAGGP
jgi:predicted Na+-dependent transporter